MRAKLPIALALGALLILPVLAQTLHSRSAQQDNGSSGTQTSGDTLQLPPTYEQSVINAGPLPSRGMTMAQVEKSHGTPALRKAPVGSPPITRWEYPGFVVYFEYRHVITSVTKVTQ